MEENRKNRTKLGQKIYETRRKMKLSQIEFAQKTGLSETTIVRIENGKRAKFYISILKKLSEAFPDVLPLEDLTKLAGYMEEGEVLTLTLAQKVKNARLTKGLSQELFAQKTGLSETTIRRIENDNMAKFKISTLKKLSEAFPDVLPLEDLTKLAGYIEKQEENMKTLASLIKEARLREEFSQEDLEEKSGIRVAVIQAIESGRLKKPRVNTLYILSKALELDFVELLTICGYIKTEKFLLGQIIWNARLSNNLTREELAKKCFMSQRGIAFIEYDEVMPRENTLRVLAGELNLNLEELLKFCRNSEVEKARLNANFTQEQLAKKSGISLKTIKNIEEGKARPQLRILTKIAKVLPELDLQELKEKYGYH